MPFVFSHSKYCDMNFVYGFRSGNACATVVEYWRHYPNQRRPSKGVFKCSPNDAWNWLSSKYLCAVWLNIWVNILQMIERSPKLYTLRIASHIGVSHMQLWQTLHEEDLHPYHDQRVQLLELEDLAQCTDLCN